MEYGKKLIGSLKMKSGICRL